MTLGRVRQDGANIAGAAVPPAARAITAGSASRRAKSRTPAAAWARSIVTMKDLGGVDPAAVILGLDIRPVEAVGVDHAARGPVPPGTTPCRPTG